jgi:hypothetical protein
MLAWGCCLLHRPKTISSDLGVVESAPEPMRFSIPDARSSPFPRSRSDKHKYIFGIGGTGFDSGKTCCSGSPGQNMKELSGCASHLRGVRGLAKRTNAMSVFWKEECIGRSRVRMPSKPKRTSQSSTLDSCAQLSQSTDSTKCTSWKWGDNSGTSSSPSETKDDSRGSGFGRERVATRIVDSEL